MAKSRANKSRGNRKQNRDQAPQKLEPIQQPKSRKSMSRMALGGLVIIAVIVLPAAMTVSSNGPVATKVKAGGLRLEMAKTTPFPSYPGSQKRAFVGMEGNMTDVTIDGNTIAGPPMPLLDARGNLTRFTVNRNTVIGKPPE